jgi:hypothetical protein
LHHTKRQLPNLPLPPLLLPLLLLLLWPASIFSPAV